jgi:glycosyltransferase involved in cell wall biosynthesis
MNQQASTNEKNKIRVLMMPDYRPDNPYQELLANSLKTEGVEVQFPQGYRRVFPIFRAITTQAQAVDILHLHWLNPYLKGMNPLGKLIYCLKFLLDLFLVQRKGYKIVWTIHNSLPHEAKFPILELWTRRFVAKLVDQILIHQACSIPELAALYQFDSGKAVVIPHGNYREIYKTPISQLEARKKLDLPLKGLIYLNLGMLRPYKGVDQLLDVWKNHQEILKEDTLVIAGKAAEDSYGEILKEKASSLSNVVLHNNFIEDNLIHLYFSAADLVVCPFRKILTSGSIILAMSFGKPVIAPRFNTIAETLGKADALLYDPDYEQGLAEALSKSKQQDKVALSRIVIEERDRLDWSKISPKLYNVYDSLISN